MRLKNNSWVFEKALTKEQCEELIQYGNEQISDTATTGGGKTPKKTLRSSEVAWLHDPWILEILEDYVENANHYAGWGFEWQLQNQVQFTKYGVGDHYNWHKDTEIPETHDGKVRKLSITVTLNDDYEGGKLFIDTNHTYGKKDPKHISKVDSAGSICVFPSDTWHKISKVTKGTRYSLVVWLTGEAWK